MKLIPLSDFVLEQEIRMSNPEIFKSKVYAYANFLKQPLTLGMFVPCDEDGNIIDNESRYPSLQEALNLKLDEDYAKAGEKVLFEGFTLSGVQIENKELRLSVYLDTFEFVEHHENGYRGGYIGEIVESLSNCSLQIELTPSALEAIGFKNRNYEKQ
ncbi:hypothetical protein [Chryseobacterium aureum]|uniref:hypothetical protein n=1 Tax=Chryseobacterium aureum TaxID=2497456 RepID=UPI000F893C71|nr:hypothetical protein [Chryseobacterium aureum]